MPYYTCFLRHGWHNHPILLQGYIIYTGLRHCSATHELVYFIQLNSILVAVGESHLRQKRWFTIFITKTSVLGVTDHRSRRQLDQNLSSINNFDTEHQVIKPHSLPIGHDQVFLRVPVPLNMAPTICLSLFFIESHHPKNWNPQPIQPINESTSNYSDHPHEHTIFKIQCDHLMNRFYAWACVMVTIMHAHA